jgi:hypothetical protein
MSILRAVALAALMAAGAAGAHASPLQLGTQDFSDGQVLGCFSPLPGCTNAWTSASDVFNRFSGSDPGIAGASDFRALWSFDLSSIGPERPGAVRVEFGLYDHDSAAPGSQLDAFFLNPGSAGAQDLTALLEPLLEAPGIGEQREYNVFGVDLPRSALDSLLASSVATFELRLKGPVLIEVRSGAGLVTVSSEGTNGAGLDFARLTLGGATTPEPAVIPLAGLALALLALVRTRAK